MRTLLLFRGAPGCGKSTFIKEHGLGDFTLSADEIRLMYQSPQIQPDGSYAISQKNDSAVWSTLLDLLEQRMKRGEFTVIDATNSKTKEINQYKSLAKQYRYRIYLVDMTGVPIEECKKRNASRESLKIVPEEVIDKMYSRFATQKIPGGVTVLDPSDNVMDKISYKPENFDNWKKVHIIGDVHGCYSCLNEYLGNMNPDELYIFVGDYLDRGIENAEMFKFLVEMESRKRDGQRNMIFIEGNHEHYISDWAHDSVTVTSEFATQTLPQIVKGGADKALARKVYSMFAQCCYFEYDGKIYFASHGGLSFVPEYMVIVPTEQMIKGVGRYSDLPAVAESWKMKTPDNCYQVFGHRNIQGYPIDMGSRCFNLQGNIEFGRHLRCLELEHGKDPVCVETKNNVFREESTLVTSTPDGLEEVAVVDMVDRMRHSRFVQEKKFDTISSFNFTRDAFYKKHWDEVTTKARGLFVDTNKNKIVARSYDKFFAVDERTETRVGNLQRTMTFPAVAYVKENGFLGLLSYNEDTDELRFASKSSLDGPFATIFKTILWACTTSDTRKKLKEYTKQYGTLVFEVIDPEHDPHIIEYDKAQVVLLDAIKNTVKFESTGYETLKSIANDCSIKVKEKATEFNDWTSFYTWYEEVTKDDYRYNGQHIEGFVVRDARGYMVKLKLAYYKYWKRMRGVMQSVQKRGYIEKTSQLYDALSNAFYGFMKDLYEEDKESFRNENIISLRWKFYEQKGI